MSGRYAVHRARSRTTVSRIDDPAPREPRLSIRFCLRFSGSQPRTGICGGAAAAFAIAGPMIAMSMQTRALG
jgi:hypothetical protein